MHLANEKTFFTEHMTILHLVSPNTFGAHEPKFIRNIQGIPTVRKA